MSETANSKTLELLEKAAKASRVADDENSVTGARRVFSSSAEAEKAFEQLSRKITRVALWNDFSPISSFELFDRDGRQTENPAAEQDFIKITLPGSGKADWVKIVEIFRSPDEIVVTIQPSSDPNEAENGASTSHFFAPDSTNNFCLRKENDAISFHVIGLNEKTNTEDTGGVLESARNFVTANVGYFLGIQKTQWQRFCENFLATVKNEK